MELRRSDITATVLTGLVVVVFAAAQQGWGVPLVGSSNRWAAAVILVLGVLTCAQGSPQRGVSSVLLGTLGVVALTLAVLALASGSVTTLSLLVVDIVVLWSVSTLRHVLRQRGSTRLAT